MNTLNFSDSIDSYVQLEKLLKKRFGIVHQVGIYKKIKNIPPLDQKRWDEVIERIKTRARESGISEDVLEKFWNQIHEIAKNLEGNVKTRKKGVSDASHTLPQLREQIDTLDTEIIAVLKKISDENAGDKFPMIISGTLKRVSKTLSF